MKTARMEAFSDGVIAVIITIMVLEMKVPHGTQVADLAAVWPVFLSYVLSYINVGIYWSNHHHLLHAVPHVGGHMLWANLHLLFWLSLMPFATGWMGENHFAPLPTAAYGVVLLMSALSWTLLQAAIIAVHGRTSTLARAVGRDFKGKLSLVAYLLAVPSALFVSQWIAGGLYIMVALLWFIPDKRIERMITE